MVTSGICSLICHFVFSNPRCCSFLETLVELLKDPFIPPATTEYAYRASAAPSAFPALLLQLTPAIGYGLLLRRLPRELLITALLRPLVHWLETLDRASIQTRGAGSGAIVIRIAILFILACQSSWYLTNCPTRD